MDIESPVKQPFDEMALSDENLYLKMKEIEGEIEFLKLQEDFIREEHKNLKKELLRAKEEIKRIQAVPLVIGQFIEMVDLEHGKRKLKQAW
jgi:26S proteasome regulatory subunit T3